MARALNVCSSSSSSSSMFPLRINCSERLDSASCGSLRFFFSLSANYFVTNYNKLSSYSSLSSASAPAAPRVTHKPHTLSCNSCKSVGVCVWGGGLQMPARLRDPLWPTEQEILPTYKLSNESPGGWAQSERSEKQPLGLEARLMNTERGREREKEKKRKKTSFVWEDEQI